MEKKILVAIPHCGNMIPELAEVLLNLRKTSLDEKIKYDVRFLFSNGRPIPSNRNLIGLNFLDTPADYLLMIDSDIVPTKAVLALADNDFDICSADIHTNRGEYNVPLSMYKDPKEKGKYRPTTIGQFGPVEVDATGTGCMMIKRHVLEKVPRPWFEDEFDKDGYRQRGEDILFCERAKEKGFKIMYDTRFTTKHYRVVPF